jgi:hypothetical protein
MNERHRTRSRSSQHPSRTARLHAHVPSLTQPQPIKKTASHRPSFSDSRSPSFPDAAAFCLLRISCSINSSIGALHRIASHRI